VIRITPRPVEQTFLYVSPQIGRDSTVGTFTRVFARLESDVQSEGTSAVLAGNASDVEGIYVGLQLKILAGAEAEQIGDIIQVCVRERERESVCLCVCVCLCSQDCRKC